MKYIVLFACIYYPLALSSPAFAADRIRWQELMTSGHLAFLTHDINNAEHYLAEARQEATILSTDEQYMSIMELAELNESQGRYAEAESDYRKLIELSPTPPGDIYSKLACVVDKLRRPDDAKQIRLAHPYPDSESKIGLNWVKKQVSAAVKKQWHPPKSFESKVATVRFRLSHSNDGPVAYLADSSGNYALDRACLKAVETASLTLPPGLEAAVVEFSFDYNVFNSLDARNGYDSGKAAAKPGPILRNKQEYQRLRVRLEEQVKSLGPDHIEVAKTMSDAAAILAAMNNSEAAIKAYQRAAEIWDSNKITSTGSYSTFRRYADQLFKSKQYAEAEVQMRRALTIAEVVYPSDDSTEVANCKTALTKILTKLHHNEEATQVPK